METLLITIIILSASFMIIYIPIWIIIKIRLALKTKPVKYPTVSCVHKDQIQYNCTVHLNNTDRIIAMSICKECLKKRITKGDIIVLH